MHSVFAVNKSEPHSGYYYAATRLLILAQRVLIVAKRLLIGVSPKLARGY